MGAIKKALVARNVATATDYYKEAYLDGQIILLVNTYNRVASKTRKSQDDRSCSPSEQTNRDS